MASIFSHPAVLLGLGPTFGFGARSRRVLWAGAACAVAPDLDVIGYGLGIPYGSLFGHRGLTHSLAFAAALAAVLTAITFRRDPSGGSRRRIGVFLFLCAASHGFFDAMTDGGRGVAFLAPFDARRFFLPWRPIPVSPIGPGGFLGARGAAILAAEVLWIWIPALLTGAAALMIRRLSGRREPEAQGRLP